jgi:hypothetical protein
MFTPITLQKRYPEIKLPPEPSTVKGLQRGKVQGKGSSAVDCFPHSANNLSGYFITGPAAAAADLTSR